MNIINIEFNYVKFHTLIIILIHCYYSIFWIIFIQSELMDLSAKIEWNRLFNGSMFIGLFLNSSEMDWFEVTIST